MKKILFLFSIFVICLFTSCVSTQVEEYQPGLYSITAFNSDHRQDAFNKAIEKTEELGCLFFSYAWSGNTISFKPVTSQEYLTSWTSEPYSSKYYDTRDGSIKIVPKYHRVNDDMRELKTGLEDFYSTGLDTKLSYKDTHEKIKEHNFIINTLRPEGFIDYGLFYVEKEDGHKWYYPLKRVNLYYCNLDGVKLLCDFAYDINKRVFDYTNNDFVYENWNISIGNGYFNSAGILSQDYKVYLALSKTYLPTDYFVIEYVYGFSCKVYCIYYCPKGVNNKVYITSVCQFKTE